MKSETIETYLRDPVDLLDLIQGPEAVGQALLLHLVDALLAVYL